jgi:tRNA modification GTPase
MFATDDTIVALATPPGRGALGTIRLSGPRSRAIASRLLDRDAPLEPRRATTTRVRGERSTLGPLDQVVATLFAAPHSYTGEDVIEITAHGNPVVLDAVIHLAQAAGARLAEPGEFTLRAFLNGKQDLIQAEAVADLIAAATPLQARVAFDQLEGTLTDRIRRMDAALFDVIARLEASLDFPDEGYHFIDATQVAQHITTVLDSIDALLEHAGTGRMIREGATVVIAGRTNVGKSSIFNVLSGSPRAIVTSVPGTTRDMVTETIDVEGLAVTLVDTAGWRDTSDPVEREGVDRGVRAQGVADLVLLVLDGGVALTDEDRSLLDRTNGSKRIVVINKADLRSEVDESVARAETTVRVSALHEEGFDALRRAIARGLTGHDRLRDTTMMSNRRHIALLEECRASLEAARRAAGTESASEEFVLTDLQAARARLDDIVGTRTNEDVLRHIFERFCVGK